GAADSRIRTCDSRLQNPVSRSANDHRSGRDRGGVADPAWVAAGRPEVFLPDLAGSLNTQSNRLADLGRWDEPRAAINESVEIRPHLAATMPYIRGNLGRSLTSLGVRLTERGDFDGALAADREDAALYKELATLDRRTTTNPCSRLRTTSLAIC